ncbi:hypothetical protein LTR22_026202 [Elasticomyces elasticus]|nr:hypothetical protein LTR22_026202 [Elasticomyces elasticus]KAK4907868.1 hypothetical protein LTR49_023142 [Elasticomyces elasticus]KAK5740872.1 hypothetical protein LTS12_024788 [Elasticomyces elasticus]
MAISAWKEGSPPLLAGGRLQGHDTLAPDRPGTTSRTWSSLDILGVGLPQIPTRAAQSFAVVETPPWEFSDSRSSPVQATTTDSAMIFHSTDSDTILDKSTMISTSIKPTSTESEGVTVWITNGGDLSPSLMQTLTIDTGLTSPTLSLSTTFNILASPSTTIPATTSATPTIATSASTANDTWIYPTAAERFAIAVANPLAVVLVCLIVFVITRFDTQRRRRGMEARGPEARPEEPRAMERNVSGFNIKLPAAMDSSVQPERDTRHSEEEMTFEEFMGPPETKIVSEASEGRRWREGQCD